MLLGPVVGADTEPFVIVTLSAPDVLQWPFGLGTGSIERCLLDVTTAARCVGDQVS